MARGCVAIHNGLFLPPILVMANIWGSCALLRFCLPTILISDTNQIAGYMSQPTITFIINKIPYALTATNVEAIKKMPSADRQQLMALLEAIKREENATQPSTIKAASTQSSAPQYISPDALMSQLAMEDKLNQKPGLTIQSVYKWVAGITVGIIVLILVF